MRRLPKYILIIAAVIGIGAGACIYANHRAHLVLKKSKDSLEADLATNVPQGAHKAVVIDFLNRRSMTYVEFNVPEGELPGYGAPRIIEARTAWMKIWSCESVTMSMQSSILIRFKLDRNDKLLSYSVKVSTK